MFDMKAVQDQIAKKIDEAYQLLLKDARANEILSGEFQNPMLENSLMSSHVAEMLKTSQFHGANTWDLLFRQTSAKTERQGQISYYPMEGDVPRELTETQVLELQSIFRSILANILRT